MPDHLYTCQRCGQARIPARLVEPTPCGGVYTVPPYCDQCAAQDRAPQGETVRLFEPAPTQLPGQTFFERHGREMNSDEQRADRWARLDARNGIRSDR